MNYIKYKVLYLQLLFYNTYICQYIKVINNMK